MRIKNAAYVLTAVEAARQWARNNPEKANEYIDKATGVIDQRTGGKYHRKLDGFGSMAKKNLTGREGSRQAPPPEPRSGPDLRA